MTDLIPVSALAHLEPRPGGHWTLTRHAQGTFIAVYSMDDGTGVSYNLSSYRTKEQVDKHCNSLIYKFTGAPELDGEKEYDRPQPSHGPQPPGYPMLSPMHIVLPPRAHAVDRETEPKVSFPQIASAGNFQQGHLGSVLQPQAVTESCYSLFNGQTPQAEHQGSQEQFAQLDDPSSSQQIQQDQLMGIQPWEIPDAFPTTDDMMMGVHGDNSMLVASNHNMQESQFFPWEPTWSDMNPMASAQGQQSWNLPF